MTEKAVYFDSSKCTACKGCQIACKMWNNLPSPLGTNEAKWSGTHQNPVDLNGDTRLIITFNELEGDSKIKPVKWAFGRRACQHCTDAPCASVCPGGALVRNEETGFVEVYQDKCVGCQYCHSACPFDVPRYESNGLLDKTVIDKCTGCADRVAVRSCRLSSIMIPGRYGDDYNQGGSHQGKRIQYSICMTSILWALSTKSRVCMIDELFRQRHHRLR